MADPALVSYVKKNLQKGYSESSIRQALQKQGYDSQTITDTIRAAKANTSSSKKPLIILAAVMLLAIATTAFFVFNTPSAHELSDTDLQTGASFSVQEKQEVRFSIQEQPHLLTFEQVTQESVSVLVQSDPIRINLRVGEEKNLVVYDDGFYDLLIRLEQINEGVPVLYLQAINQSTCVVEWNCSDWDACSEEGTQTRECTDLNACETQENKPTLNQSCEYIEPCAPDWSCNDWSACSEQGVQTRDCTDLNTCESQENKPTLNQSCEYVAPSINPDEIIVDISFEENSYEVAQEVQGEYYLYYDGLAFEGVILYCSPNQCSSSTGNIEHIDFGKAEKTNHHKSALEEAFYEPGEYEFSMRVYSCEDINNALNTQNCEIDSSQLDAIASEVDPLQSATETIMVTEETQYVPECTSNEQCIQECVNCESQTYSCVQESSNVDIHQTCVECIIDSGCIDGYMCEDNICVQEPEQESETEAELVTNPQTILDCYNENLSEMLCSAEDSLQFTTDFETRLSTCELTQGTFALGLEPMLGIFRGYDIQQEQEGVCKVNFWFLETTLLDPSLSDKEMICNYNQSQRTIDDVNECYENCCTGELADAIQNLG